MIIFFSVHKIVTHFSHDRTGSRTLASNLTDHCSPHWAILLWQIIQYCTYIRINIIFDLFFGFFQSSSVFFIFSYVSTAVQSFKLFTQVNLGLHLSQLHRTFSSNRYRYAFPQSPLSTYSANSNFFLPDYTMLLGITSRS